MRLLRALALVVSVGAVSTGSFVACGSSDNVSSPKPDGSAGQAGADGGGTGGASGSGGSAGVDGSAGSDGGQCTVTFVIPVANAQLTNKDDANGDNCVDGFQYTVSAAVIGDEGGTATLYADTQQLAQTTVTGGVASFANVQLPSSGTTTLKIVADAGCDASEDVSVQCAGAPTCDIVKPVIAADHPDLNGVPASQGGDRVSADGSPYQVALEVDTSVADGQPVLLKISGSATGVTGTASGGKALFPGVTLSPDGDYDVTATCVPVTGINGTSTAHYTVDSLAPDLSVLKVTAAGTSALQSGDHFAPADDADTNTAGLQIRVCGTTTAADAIDLPATLGANQNNFCVAVGTGSPTCVAASTGGAGSSGDGACVNFDCPGNGTFDVTTTLKDAAGNPTATTVTNITCAATNPSVQFLDPVGDTSPFSDVSKHILAASMATGQRKDNDAAKAGTQYDVTACTTAADGTAVLMGGRQGNTLAQIATANVVADSAGQCPTGFPSIVTFLGVTLPESSTGQGFVLSQATELNVSVTDTSTASGSATIDLWVDSQVPSLSITAPAGLCGMYFSSATAVTKNVVFNTSIAPVTFTIDGTTVPNQGSLVFNTVTFTGVSFPVGTSQLAASVTKPSGNVGYLQSPCAVDVGSSPPPTVTWSTPVTGNSLGGTAATGSGVIADADGATADWQGTLKVCTNINVVANPTATVQFSAAGTNVGSPVTLDASGCATLNPATVLEGTSVALKATTSLVNGAVGTATINVPVDVTAPAAVTNFAAVVKERRQTSFNLTWLAPDDGGKAAGGYDVRVSNAVIDTQTKFDAAERVTYASTPAAPGTTDSITVADRLIETDFYFAIAATDIGGNRGPMMFTSAATRASFKTVELTPNTTNQRFGWAMDGSSDLNGDGYSDIVVGHGVGQDARIYFGSASGVPTSPSVVISGNAIDFGEAAAPVGDINFDGKPDLAIGSWGDGDGKVFVYYGRDTWPMTLTEADADVTIVPDSASDPKFSASRFGLSIARLGDFNGDGLDDFAVGAPVYANGVGYVAIVLGKAGGLSAALTVPTTGNTIAIPGVAGQTSWFGLGLTGLGGFYGSAATRGLMVGAPFYGGTKGQLFAFKGRTGTGGIITASSADHVLAGATNWYLGLNGLNPIGNVGAANRPAFGFSLNALAPSGEVLLTTGSTTAGPFAQTTALLGTAESTSRSFGEMVMGGGFPGTPVTVSVIGSGTPDLVVSTRASGNPRLFIVDGDKLATAGAALQNIEGLADIVYPLPGTFTSFSRYVTPLRDINGDGFGDIAVGDTDYTASPVTGRVVVLY